MNRSSLAALLILLGAAQQVYAADSQSTVVIKRVMQTADTNKDDKLSLAEYLPLDVQAKHHGEQHFKAGDANHDGLLMPDELASTLQKQTWFAILSEGVEPAFKRLDKDANGKLDAAEYRKISRMGAHAEQHFKGADANKDGSLSLTEFTAHAEQRLRANENSPRPK